MALLAQTSRADDGTMLKEDVEVRRVAVQVTFWPKDGDVSLCARLPELVREGAVTLTVNEAARPIESLDVSPGLPPGEDLSSPVAVTAVPAKQIVLLFDWWHMGGGVSCTGGAVERMAGRALAFASARLVLGDPRLFRSGVDRVLLASFAGWLEIHSGPTEDWITDPREALEILDAMERRPRDSYAETFHRDLDGWFRQVGYLVEALGAVPGHKDLFLLASDLPIDAGETPRLAALSGACLRNRVGLHPVDLASKARVLPFGLQPLAEWTGGHLFTNADAELSKAMQTLDRLGPCRATLYFAPRPSERRRDMRIRIDVADRRFRVEAPRVYRPARDAARQKATAVMFFRNFHGGMRLGADLLLDVPVRKKWRAAVKVDVSALEPAVLDRAAEVEFVVEVINMDRKQVRQSETWRVDARQLAQRAAATGATDVVFRPSLVSPGPVRIWVGASVRTDSGAHEWLAVSQRDIEVPAIPAGVSRSRD